MERSQTVEAFRERLLEVIDNSRLSRTAFAQRCGIDRSTLSQILSPSADRLPRVETLVAIALAEQVSLDWLLGLSEEGAVRADILEQDVEITGGPLPSDEQLNQWRTEALGYKIRHVPATLPDLVRTQEVLAYEFQSAEDRVEQRAEVGRTLLEYERRPETDTEVCSPLQTVQSLAQGVDLWSELSREARRDQLLRMSAIAEELYPTFRWFLFDARAIQSAPVTIFGPLRAALYIGGRYLVLNGKEQVATMTRHFDALIRAAVVQPHEAAKLFARLAASCE